MGIFYDQKQYLCFEECEGREAMDQKKQFILAVDPGRIKCGLAIISRDEVLLREVVAREKICTRIGEVLPNQGPIVVGDRTGSEDFIIELKEVLPELNQRIITVDEHLSSVEAKNLYWRDHPPRGWRRLIPTSLQTPPVAIDDYVAVILAKRYQNGK